MSSAARDVLRRFFVLGYDELRSRLTRRLGSAELAADALHETWLQIERAEPSGHVHSPRNYLLQMAANLAAKQRASDNRLVTLSDAKHAIGLVDEDPDPERAVLARSDIQALARALSELSPRRREVLLASRVHGETMRSIASRLGISLRLAELELRDALAHCALRLQRLDTRSNVRAAAREDGEPR
ncbi:sigma-70 family RNA polymerase sigma factor [Hyphomicrobium sp. NDB2Meth4]|uniref:RNA polymerase sigma factor n=1 Tax=Hyphomicrobium sp. NDB2Meth4 TaxID=1892846 RepID=UPI0009315074|nr:sigma-70 family RNA polymerase sigma factor [Hyphomicrobium sp. NDB2Meth4]